MPTVINVIVSHRCPFHPEVELQTVSHPNNRLDILPCPKCRDSWVEKVRSLEEINKYFEKQRDKSLEIKKGLEITITGLQKELKAKTRTLYGVKIKSKGGKNRS